MSWVSETRSLHTLGIKNSENRMGNRYLLDRCTREERGLLQKIKPPPPCYSQLTKPKTKREKNTREKAKRNEKKGKVLSQDKNDSHPQMMSQMTTKYHHK